MSQFGYDQGVFLLRHRKEINEVAPNLLIANIANICGFVKRFRFLASVRRGYVFPWWADHWARTIIEFHRFEMSATVEIDILTVHH